MRFLVLSAALLGITSSAAAFDCSNYTVSLGAEAIYWRACSEGLTYGVYSSAATANDFGNSEQIEMAPDYGWGFWLHGTLESKCSHRFVELEWLRFSNTTSAVARNDSSVGPLRTSTPVPEFSTRTADLARARQDNVYNHVAVRFAQNFVCNCWGQFYGYLGGGSRNLRVESVVHYEGVAQQFSASRWKTRLKMSMGSIDFGMGALAHLFCGFDAKIRLGSFVAIGDMSYFLRLDGEINGNPGFDQSFSPPQTHCISGLDLDASIGYSYQCGCFCLRGDIGYRLDYYLGIETRVNFSDEDGPTTATFRGYGGPYIGLTVGY